MTRKIRTHVITGHRNEVHAAMSRAYTDGRLVAITEGRALAGERVRLVAKLREPGGRPRWEHVRPWLVVAAKAAAVAVAMAALAGLIWLVVLAVMELIALVAAVVAWVSSHWPVIVLVVVGLLALLFSGGRCGGIHCGGCRG